MSEKKEFNHTQTIAPLPVVLVGCVHPELGINLLTVVWTGVLCSEPLKLHVSIRPERYSHRMISRSGCFTMNLPARNLLEQVDFCGNVSGRDCDKWAMSGLTPLTGKKVDAPIVAECPVNFECIVEKVLPLGTHDMFIGRVVYKRADSDIITEEGKVDFSRLELFAYVSGEYLSMGKVIGRHGFSASKAG